MPGIREQTALRYPAFFVFKKGASRLQSFQPYFLIGGAAFLFCGKGDALTMDDHTKRAQI